MGAKCLLVFLMVCNAANSKEVNIFDCNDMMQQDDTYWCIMDKYQQSVLELKDVEILAKRQLEKNDALLASGKNDDGVIEHDPYVYIAKITLQELHLKFIIYREEQCRIAPLKFGPLPGYHASIEYLYCKTQMNISQIQWIKSFI